jgi:hypothetical protein
VKAATRSVLSYNPESRMRANAKRGRQIAAQQRIARQGFLPYEDDIMRRYYPLEGEQVFKRMDRPVHIIRARAKALGLEYTERREAPRVSSLCADWMNEWFGRRLAGF